MRSASADAAGSRLAQGAATAGIWPLRVGHDRVTRADGVEVALLECGACDVTTLDADRRTAVVSGFERLCRTLRTSLQLVVQVRRLLPEAAPRPGSPPASPVADALLRSEDAHARMLLAAEPAFRRRVVAVCRATAAGRSLDRDAEVVRQALGGAGIDARRLTGASLATALAGAWTGDEEGTGGGVLEPPWSEHPTHLRCGPLLLRGWRLRRLPGTSVEPGWLAPLLRVRAECDIAIHLHPAEVGDAVSRLDRRLRSLRADQLLRLDHDRVDDAAVEAGVDAAVDLRDRLARNIGNPVWLSVTAVARATDDTTLEASTDALRSGLGATLAWGEPAHFEHLGAALSTWPLGEDRSPRRKLTDTAAASTCIPLVEAVCDDPGGYHLGRTAAGDLPVRLAPFDTSRHTNANIAILAASGRGKSYALGAVILSAAARGIGSIVVDPEGEHAALVRALGGEVLDLRPGCGSALNVFECGDLASDDRRAEISGAVVALVEVLAGGLGEVERALVDSAAQGAIRRATEEDRVAVLGDCVDALRRDAPRVAVVLDRFCTGALGELFNRPTSINLTASVVGISLRDLRDELVPAATLVVAEWLWALVRSDRRPRHLVFDEVGLLCAHAPLRSLLAQLARRCRKYHASLVIATQNAGDLLSSEEGRVMATNPAIVLLGGHRGAETQRMEQAYSLTARQRAALEGAARGEFLLLAGTTRLPIRIEVSPLHHALLTGAPVPPVGALHRT